MGIDLRFCRVSRVGDETLVQFHDGTSVPACPHDTHHYHVIAHRCGYGDDIAAYCFEHEFAHCFMEEKLYGRPSQILYGIARGLPLHPQDAAYEEMMAQAFQRWLRANERPIIGGVDWDGLKASALVLLDARVEWGIRYPDSSTHAPDTWIAVEG